MVITGFSINQGPIRGALVNGLVFSANWLLDDRHELDDRAIMLAGISIGDRIIRAFDPLMDVVTSAAYPIAALMMATGFLLIVIGQRHKGLEMMKWAAVGYIGIQFLPFLLTILREVGKAMVAP